MNTFTKLVQQQWEYGGKKYASTAVKESTDILVDDYGFNWLLGTLNKYIYRYKNLGREKDLLKVACYCFIIWLKFGFHIVKGYGTAGDNYTTVKAKAMYWDEFIKVIQSVTLDSDDLKWKDKHKLLDDVTAHLLDLRTCSNRHELPLIAIYQLMEQVWKLDGFDKKEVHDQDTWLEGKGKSK